MESKNVMYSVTLTNTNAFVFDQRYYEIFNHEFYVNADAEIIINTIIVNSDSISFTLEEQTRDVSFGNFTKEKITECLENIKQDNNLNFNFSIVEIENTQFRNKKNSTRTRGGKKSRRKVRKSKRRRRNFKTTRKY